MCPWPGRLDLVTLPWRWRHLEAYFDILLGVGVNKVPDWGCSGLSDPLGFGHRGLVVAL